MRPLVQRFAPLAALLGAVAALGGCAFLTGEKKVQPPPLEFTIQNPYPEPVTLAIAPAINLSGSRDFDVLVVSDTLYAEMQQVPGLNVLPLNRTLMAMQRLGVRTIDDPATAQKLAQALHADGLVIPAITAYDPYNPPLVGMILQLYTPPGGVLNPQAHFTPVLQSNPDRPTLATDTPATGDHQPVAQVNGIFNASNQTVLKELRVYAGGRTQYDSALMDQRFLMDADAYMRFVCHAMSRRLMEMERQRLSDR